MLVYINTCNPSITNFYYIYFCAIKTCYNRNCATDETPDVPAKYILLRQMTRITN